MDVFKDHKNDGDADRDDGVATLRTGTYRIQYGSGGLRFQHLELDDPCPLGRQILAEAGVRDPHQHALLALLPNGDIEDVRLDEPFDLRSRGVERFIGFETDRLYRATLLDRALLWGKATISGEELQTLAGVGEDQALYVDVPGGTDRLIERGGSLDLGALGAERIVAGPRHAPGTFEISVVYNGLVRKVRVHSSDTAAATVVALRPLLGSPAGDLVLVNEGGVQLAPGATLGQQGVGPQSRLQLRPPVVQGG